MTTTATCTWAKGKQGDWLVRGPVGLSGTVTVSKRDGSTSQAELGRMVWSSADVALYAVAPRGKHYDPQAFAGYRRPPGRFVRSCPTGGNCSSVGSGKSCGAEDCDGW